MGLRLEPVRQGGVGEAEVLAELPQGRERVGGVGGAGGRAEDGHGGGEALAPEAAALGLVGRGHVVGLLLLLLLEVGDGGAAGGRVRVRRGLVLRELL